MTATPRAADSVHGVGRECPPGRLEGGRGRIDRRGRGRLRDRDGQDRHRSAGGPERPPRQADRERRRRAEGGRAPRPGRRFLGQRGRGIERPGRTSRPDRWNHPASAPPAPQPADPSRRTGLHRRHRPRRAFADLHRSTESILLRCAAPGRTVARRRTMCSRPRMRAAVPPSPRVLRRFRPDTSAFRSCTWRTACGAAPSRDDWPNRHARRRTSPPTSRWT